MDLPIGKVAPTAVVAAVVSYCCWSHLDEANVQAEAKGRAELTEVAAALLRPATPPDPARDPFGLLPMVAAIPEPKTKKPEAAADASPTARALARAESARLLSGLALSATWVQGKRAVALINGRVYAAGEFLKEGKGGRTAAVVTQVLTDRVILNAQGETLELKFPDKDAKSAPATKDTPQSK
jgi:hypothetical protein